MPTGYSYIIEKGATFAQFVWRCARAFGANIMMKDDPLATKICEYKPDDYYTEALAEAKERLAALRAMTIIDAESRALSMYNKKVLAWQESTSETRRINNLYTNMLAQVEQWTPPTERHTALKQFMIQQIKGSLDACDYPKPVLKSGKDWLVVEIADAYHWVEYYTKHLDEEIALCKERNEWNAQLRASVSMPNKLDPE